MAKTKIIGKQFLTDELKSIEGQIEQCKMQFNMLRGAQQTLEQQLAHLEKQNGDNDAPEITGPQIVDPEPGDSDGEEVEGTDSP